MDETDSAANANELAALAIAVDDDCGTLVFGALMSGALPPETRPARWSWSWTGSEYDVCSPGRGSARGSARMSDSRRCGAIEMPPT